jgi:hypothetical protein
MGPWFDQLAHRVAYEVFVGPIEPEELYTCHHCDCRPCINPKHLFLGTCADNLADMVAKGRQAFGERNGNAKLTEEQVGQIKFLLIDGRYFQHTIAERFGVDRGLICQIGLGMIWSWVPPATNYSGPLIKEKQECRPNAVLTEQQISIIKRLLFNGIGRREIALLFDVSRPTIGRIDRGERWSWVEPLSPDEPIILPDIKPRWLPPPMPSLEGFNKRI